MPLDFGDFSGYYNKNIDYDAGISPGDFKFKPKGGSSSFFNYGQSGSSEKKGGLEQAGGILKDVFANSEKRRQRDAMINALRERAQPFGGTGMAGRTTRLGDGTLTQVDPNTYSPIVIPGGGGVAQGPSTGQRVAGGALSGFVSSGFNPIGALVGGIGGLFG
jgi:hypothetical protein